MGVYIDDKLNWHKHVSHIIKKISKSIGIINKLKRNFDIRTKCLLYYSFIYPYLQYCIVAWGSASPSTLLPLKRKQKRAIRVISGSEFYAHTQELFKNLKMLKLEDIYKLEVVKFVSSQLNTENPIITYHRNATFHAYNTRQGYLLRQPQSSSEQSRRFVTVEV